jgi:hypothetical protein
MSLSLLAQIILRQTVSAGFVTKGDEIEFAEEDLNFIILANAIRELNAASEDRFEPFDVDAEYSDVLPDYVSYDGNIWEYINAVPQTGIEPGSDPSVWELSSSGAFAHEKNKDQYLDKGGNNEVTAEELRTAANAIPDELSIVLRSSGPEGHRFKFIVGDDGYLVMPGTDLGV